MKYGYVKVASAVPTVKVADCVSNIKEIESQIAMAEGQGAEIIVFPELCVTGYTCQDLFRQQLLLDATENCVMQLLEFSRQLDIISIIGVPLVAGDLLLNCAVVIQRGKILGIVPKTFLPNYSEFYEKRWFAGPPTVPYWRRSVVRRGDLRGRVGSHASEQPPCLGGCRNHLQPLGER